MKKWILYLITLLFTACVSKKGKEENNNSKIISPNGQKIETVYKSDKFDFTGDGVKDELNIEIKNSILCLDIGSFQYSLGATTIKQIYNENNEDDILRIFDIDGDGKSEIAISVDDTIFGNRSSFNIYKFVDKQLTPMKFYYNGDKYFNGLIAFDDLILIDNENHIFCYSSNSLIEGDDNTNYYQIDKYQWDTTLHRIEFVKSELYKDIDFEKISKIIF